ncbi:hypothetical protein [Leisingera sp. M523]|uniref:hypothetical protein n=1 Tax=Leisingera sp. M523 TaxID=2867013 RepID=UPI0021A5F170|nr:hypothetical protein [Leisingera sp. M523]UWQ29486.1 hypothetical protein K3557_02695 [Leisingera sp. M523]
MAVVAAAPDRVVIAVPVLATPKAAMLPKVPAINRRIVIPARPALQVGALLVQTFNTRVDSIVRERSALVLFEEDAAEFLPRGFGQKGCDLLAGHGLLDWVGHDAYFFEFQNCEETSCPAHRLGE